MIYITIEKRGKAGVIGLDRPKKIKCSKPRNDRTNFYGLGYIRKRP